MTVSIHITAHRDFASAEQQRVFEEQLLESARSFVQGLDGVTSAQFSGQTGGFDLTERGATANPSPPSAPHAPNVDPQPGGHSATPSQAAGGERQVPGGESTVA